MESWCFDSMDKGFVSTGIISTTFDSMNRLFMEGDFNIGLFPIQQFVDDPYVPDMGIVEMIHDYAGFGDVVSPCLVTSNGGSRDDDYASFRDVSHGLITSNGGSADGDCASFGDDVSPSLVASNGVSRDDDYASFRDVISPGLVTSNVGSRDNRYASFGDVVSLGLVTSNGGSRDDDYASFGDVVSPGLVTSNGGSGDDDYASFGDVISPGLVGYTGGSGDEESSSKVSSIVIDSNSQESSLIDLQLDGYGDKLDSYSIRTAHVLSSVDSCTPPQRARATSLSSQIVYCQVYGCFKDLSSAKGYHKRHKVCDVHSKSPKVIVNGVEQRFCQQCSRFHLIGEFDDGKRSCRKRLAGHNERRRKPKVGFESRSGTSFRSSTGSNFQGLNPRSTSVGCQDMLRRGTSHMDKYGNNDWVRQIKIENGTDCTQRPAYNCINGQLHPKSTSPSHIFEDNTDNSYLKSVKEENVNPHMPEIFSHSVFHPYSSGSEDLILLNETSTIEGLPGISESSRALSLLSSKSQDTLTHSFKLPEGDPPFKPSSNPHYSVNEVSEKLFGAQNRYPLFKIDPTRGNHSSSMFELNYGALGNVTHRSSKVINVKDHAFHESRNTIDLHHLSSQLYRVENQRRSKPLKQEASEGFSS